MEISEVSKELLNDIKQNNEKIIIMANGLMQL